MRVTAALVLSLASVQAFAVMPDRGRVPYFEGEVLVRYQGPAAKALDSAAAYGMTPKRVLLDGEIRLMRLPAFTTVQQMLPLLRADPAVAVAEPNFRRHKRATIPNDPEFSEQWGLRNTGQANYVSGGPAGIAGADMHLPEAWDAHGVGVPGVVVAVIDDGFDLTHPDLAPNFLSGQDTADGDGDPSPDDLDEDHGTLVAGCIDAKGNNGLGVAGVAWNVRMLPLRFGFDTASEIDAIQFARDHNAQIINASFGGPGFAQSELDSIRALAGNEILFVTAAGNDDANLDRAGFGYPANYDADNIVTVAATNRQDGIASFSTYGPVTVDVAAPGLQIITTAVGGRYSAPKDCNSDGPNSSCGVAGTSFAAPYTAGVAALIRSAFPSAGWREVKARLIEGADPGQDATNLARRRVAGGRVNAARSLALSPRPSLVLRSFVVADANGSLDPGETTNIDVVVQNLWQKADHVAVTLSAVGGAVAVNGGPRTIETLNTGVVQTLRFNVTVPAASRPHQEVFFDVALTADGGYAATRSFALEIARLTDGVQVGDTLQKDLYDEFHTYHFDVPSTAGIAELDFDTTSTADIDILVKRGAPPKYEFTLGLPCDDDHPDGICFTDADNPEDQGGGPDGNEHVALRNPQPGTYYVTVVKFDRGQNPLDYTLRAKRIPAGSSGGTTGGNGGHDGGGGGGGALSLDLLLLGMLMRVRRKRR